MGVSKVARAMAGLAVASLALSACSGAASSPTGATAASSSTAPVVAGSPTAKPTIDGTGRSISVSFGVNNLYPEQQKQWFADMSAEFKANTGATLNFETWATTNDELTKIQTSVLSGQGPDVFAVGTTFTPTAYSTNAFVKLSDADWAKVGGRAKFVPATLGISGPDATSQVGIPLRSRPFVMLYNTKMLKAAGIDKPAESWDELRAQAKKLTGNGVYGLSCGYADTFDTWKIVWSMAIQQGNPLVKDGKAMLNDPTMLNAYKNYYGWLSDGSVDPAAVGWKNAQALAAFAQGKSAYMVLTSANSLATLKTSAVASDYAYTLLPTIPPGATSLPSGGVAAASILSGDNLVVANYSKNQDLAFAFVDMVTNPAEQRHYFDVFGEFPTNAEAATALMTNDKSLSPFVAAAGKSVATPFTGAWSQVQLAIANVTVQMIPDLSGKTVTDEGIKAKLDVAQAAAQKALDQVK